MTKTSLNRILLLTSVMVFSLLVFLLFTFAGDSGASGDDFADKEPRKMLTIRSPELPKKVSFAGEPAPLDLFYVNEALDRELLVNAYWHSSTILMLKRANRWFPVIEPILKENDVPDDFKYLALIESGFTRIVSPKGAAGFWQFLEKTGKEYGLEVNDYVDERYHAEKSTEAACRYFKESHETFKNWTLVAASYNAGNRRITESLENQNGKSYYDLFLNEETSRYIYRILAIKTIYENREAYGFQISKEDLYQPLNSESLEVNTPIENLAEFAGEHGMNYKMLKEFNPWLRAGYLPNASGKNYTIQLPPKE